MNLDDFIFNEDLNKIDVKEWEKLNDQSENGNIFQSQEMYKFWEEQKGAKPFVYSIKSPQGELLAICSGVIHQTGFWPISSLTKRAIVYGGIIIKSVNYQDIIANYFLNKIKKKLSTKAIYVEIRNLSCYDKFNDIFCDNKWDYIPYQDYVIKLTSEEETFKLFTSEKRRQIRRSLREGVEVSYENSKENINGVYNVIHKIYVEKVKKPLASIEFFESLCENNFANVVALKFENKIIGGAFLLHDKKNVYDWFRGGLDREYKHQFPSTLAAWAVMKYGILNNKQSFDFMGAGIKGVDYGVRKFKSQFGGELVEYGRYLKVLKPLKYKIGVFGLSLLKKK